MNLKCMNLLNFLLLIRSSSLITAITAVIISGKAVPIATIVRPITLSLIPKNSASSVASSTTISPPNFNNILPIITKSIDEAKIIRDAYKDNYKNISVIDITTEKFNKQLVVAPAYGVKGLEFDSVIIINNFSNDKYLYYVAVTRAQHELIVYE